MIASEYDELDRELGDLADERAARKRAGGVRMLPIMVGVVSLFALGGIVWYAYTQGVREGSEVAAPLLRPDSPAKETPDDPGGRQIAGAELGVYDVVNGADGATRPSVERILPEPEEPQSLPTRAPQPVPEAQAPAAPAPPPVDSGGQTAAAPAQRQPIPEPGAQQAAPLPDASLAAPSAPPPRPRPPTHCPLCRSRAAARGGRNQDSPPRGGERSGPSSAPSASARRAASAGVVEAQREPRPRGAAPLRAGRRRPPPGGRARSRSAHRRTRRGRPWKRPSSESPPERSSRLGRVSSTGPHGEHMRPLLRDS